MAIPASQWDEMVTKKKQELRQLRDHYDKMVGDGKVRCVFQLILFSLLFRKCPSKPELKSKVEFTKV
jgi:hypothetical protein